MAKNRFFKIGGQSMLWVLVCDVYPELRNRAHVMVGVCVSVFVPRPYNHALFFLFRFSKRLFLLFVFIKFYKCGLWVFLGCQACFMCSGGVLY